jgi:hypothetical protein
MIILIQEVVIESNREWIPTKVGIQKLATKIIQSYITEMNYSKAVVLVFSEHHLAAVAKLSSAKLI